MNDLYFPVFILLPSAALFYASLSTFYGWKGAYEAISWVPLALYFSVSVFVPIRDLAPATGPDLALLLSAIAWLSLIQGSLGLVLVVRAVLKKESIGLLLVTSILSALPFVLEYGFV